VTKLLSVLVAVVLAAAVPARAQVVDLAATKCKEFLELRPDRIGFILMWLDGYYTADEDPVVVDFDNAKSKAEKLSAYCAKHPTLNVITAAESVLGKP
jgi:acid stress chaperone HdeB